MSDINDGPIEIASPNTHEEEPVLADTSSAVTTVDQTVAVKKDGAVTTTKKRRRPARPQVNPFSSPFFLEVTLMLTRV